MATENEIITYVPIIIENQLLLQDPVTTRLFPGKIIGYKYIENNCIIIITTGAPFERNATYTFNKYEDNKLVKYDYANNIISDDVKRDDYKNLIYLTKEGIAEINKIERDRDKTVQYVYTKSPKNKSA